jgi:Ca2+-binding EF-hand superfamily protein
MKKLDEDFTDKEIEKLISDADMDEDGEVNFEEFVSIMNTKFGQK